MAKLLSMREKKPDLPSVLNPAHTHTHIRYFGATPTSLNCPKAKVPSLLPPPDE